MLINNTLWNSEGYLWQLTHTDIDTYVNSIRCWTKWTNVKGKLGMCRHIYKARPSLQSKMGRQDFCHEVLCTGSAPPHQLERCQTRMGLENLCCSILQACKRRRTSVRSRLYKHNGHVLRATHTMLSARWVERWCWHFLPRPASFSSTVCHTNFVCRKLDSLS